jgi:hypothetical protein
LKTFVNKNAIKAKIGYAPGNFSRKSIPPRNFGINFRQPLLWIFNPCASMAVFPKLFKLADPKTWKKNLADHKIS